MLIISAELAIKLEMHQSEADEGVEIPENNVSKAEYYIQQLNVNNAKKVALCMVLGFICYHGLIHLRYGESFMNVLK